MEDPIVTAWKRHTSLSLSWLSGIPEPGMASRHAHGGRTVGEMLAHINNVRVDWLKGGYTTLAVNLTRIAKEEKPTQADLLVFMNASAAAIAAALERSIQEGGRFKGFKGHAASFSAYLISHEAYHHGEIGVALAQSGIKLDRKTAFMLWAWGDSTSQGLDNPNPSR